jgi:hypothetical protein
MTNNQILFLLCIKETLFDYTIPMGKKKDKQSFYKMLLHLHPKKVKESTLRFSLTFGLGGITALSFVLLVLSGLLLKSITNHLLKQLTLQ